MDREVRRRFAKVDGCVRQRVRETAAERRRVLGDVECERAVARARLDDVEMRRTAGSTPHREQLPRNKRPKNGMRQRGCVEVAQGTEGAARRVVAAVRPIERDLHELGERERAT